MRNNIVLQRCVLQYTPAGYEFMGLLITGTFGPLHPVYVYDTHTLILYYRGVIYMYLCDS
jgi:hypothetical protein